tara:strand:- start:54 stop:179 length:126 start_codon:yes stop_codon:yes gene_type:complete
MTVGIRSHAILIAFIEIIDDQVSLLQWPGIIKTAQKNSLTP